MLHQTIDRHPVSGRIKERARDFDAVKNIKIETVMVTPELAKAWLDKNKKNRKVASGTIDSYARDMKAKRWAMTGDAVRFNSDGDLVDGQHRLMACIRADAAFPSVVIYGLEINAQTQIDTGKVRRAPDMLTLHGYHYAVRLAAAARMIITTKAGAPGTGQGVKVTHSEVLAAVKRHKSLPHSVAVVEKALGPPAGMLAYVHYVASAIIKKESRADAFVKVFVTGEPDYDRCPAHALRERLLRQRDKREELRREEMFRLLAHAWNLFAKRKPIDFLRSPKTASIDGLDIKTL